MRGKEKYSINDVKNCRITPAYAGKRASASPAPSVLWDHPPRVRGKACLAQRCVGLVGITPAYAGKSQFCGMLNKTNRDHPRVCGEKTACPGPYLKSKGSPPRMRGKAHDGRQVLRGLRRHLKCDWDGHLRLVQVGNVVHERALMPDVHESQPRRTPQRHNDRMGQPVQAGMHGGSHGCRGRAAAPKCPAHHPWLLPLCRMVIRPRP